MTDEPTIPPPAPDEIEITVLGKGWGECVVVHVGQGRWIVIDSFLTTGFGRSLSEPVAALYLKDIRGVDPRAAIESVTITHLHADHYGGVDKLYANCKETAWLHLPNGPVQWDDKFASSLEALEESDLTGRYAGLEKVAAAWRLASNRGCITLCDGPQDLIETGLPATSGVIVRALAPLPALSLQSFHDVAAEQAPALAMTGPTANFTSVVILIEIANVRAILGGDMDCDEGRGWEAIAALHDQRADTPDDVTYLKVPHHASLNPQFLPATRSWFDQPVTVLTPHPAGLPHIAMVDNLRTISRSGKVYQAGHSPTHRRRGTRPKTPPVAAVIASTNTTGQPWRINGIRDVFSGQPVIDPNATSFEI